MMSLIVSYFMLSCFTRDALDEIRDRIESVPENFPTYSQRSYVKVVFRYENESALL